MQGNDNSAHSTNVIVISVKNLIYCKVDYFVHITMCAHLLFRVLSRFFFKKSNFSGV